MTTATRMARAKNRMFKCRFPGCDWKARAPQPRGRHESQAHGMVKGELPGEVRHTFAAPGYEPATVGFSEAGIAELKAKPSQVANGNGHMSPVEHLEAALADLREREKSLDLELAHLALLQHERNETHDNIIVIDKAIGDLTGTGLKA